MHYLIPALLLVFATAAQAQVYRCTNAAGKVEFSDSPCAAGVDAKVVAPSTGRDDRSLARENEELKRRLFEAESRPVAPPQPVQGVAAPAPAAPAPARAPQRTQADLQAERADSYECERAKREYDVALSSRVGKSKAPAAEMAMYSACGMRPPDRTVIIERGAPGSCVRVGATLHCR
jgi:hypothetical protein